MSTSDKHLSDVGHLSNQVKNLDSKRIVLVRALWNEAVTGALLQGALDFLKEAGMPSAGVQLVEVPGTFELTYAAAKALKQKVDGVIVLGCVVRGETAHFDYICQGVTQGITLLNTQGTVPVIFGVLTTENQAQALDRAGGKYGNKGEEAAATLLHMLSLDALTKQTVP
jgi:6,7-dimethyl-8-ribityllumazine synthase